MAGTSNQNVIISITGESTGIQKAAKSGSLALQQLNQRINDIVLSNARWDASTNKLRIGAVNQIDVVDRAKKVVAQLNAEKARAVKIEQMLTEALSKEDLALLRNQGLMQGMGNSAGSASFALLSLTQGIQDAGNFGMGAAQGIRAVNNNIQAFVTAATFAASQTEGGIVAVFKNMGKAMIGPAGILFAFSVVSAAVEFFANKSQTAKSDVEDLTKAWEDAAGSMIEFQDVMDGKKFRIPESMLKGVAEKLRKEIDAIDATIETASSSLSTELVGGLKSALVNTAAIDPIMGNIADASGKVLANTNASIEADNVILAAREEEAGFDKNKILARRELLDSFEQEIEKNERLRSIREQAEALGFNLSDDKKKERVELTEIEKLERNILALRNNMWSTDQRKIASLTVQKEYLDSLNEATEEGLVLEQKIKDLGDPIVVSGLIQIHQQEKLNEELEKRYQKSLMILGLAQIESDMLRKAPDLSAEYKKYIDDQNKIIDANQALRDSFTDLGADLIISASTIGGGLDGMQKTFGRFFIKYGAELVKMGVATVLLGVSMEGVKKALESFNGPAAIVAGTALIAAGSALSRQSKRSKDTLTGGNSSGSSFSAAPGFGVFTPASALGPPSSIGLRQSPQNITGTFYASGRDLVAVVGAEASSQQAMGIKNPLRISNN